MPSGAAIKPRNLTRLRPERLRMLQAATDDPPVANIGVQKQADVHLVGRWQLAVVFDRLQGLLVAVEADVAHLGLGQQTPDRIHHSQAGAKDRHKSYVVGKDMTSSLVQRGCDTGLGYR